SGASANSPYTVTVTAFDGTHSATGQSFTWTVNAEVTVTNPGRQSNLPGDHVNLPVIATSLGGHTLSFMAAGWPAHLSILNTTGVISGIVATSAAAVLPYEATLTVSDGVDSTTQRFQWQISNVLVNPVMDQTNKVGDGVSLQISAREVGTAPI